MAINRKKIVDDLSKLRVSGDENGMIEGFGVLVNQLPASFWNSFAERMSAKASSDMRESVEFLLKNAAHECGYHTGYGIITSEEWKAVVAPMVEQQPEDILHGAFAVLGAFGWANAEIIELKPKERMVIRAYDYYESNVVTYGCSTKKSGYMMTGICAAFMDLAYGGAYDATGKKSLHTYTCVQSKGIECGDDYGEFIVTKA
jgi:hypothetical protein